MKRLRELWQTWGCPFGIHKLVIPTGPDCFEPIYCSRCGRSFTDDGWIR